MEAARILEDICKSPEGLVVFCEPCGGCKMGFGHIKRLFPLGGMIRSLGGLGFEFLGLPVAEYGMCSVELRGISVLMRFLQVLNVFRLCLSLCSLMGLEQVASMLFGAFEVLGT